MTNPNDSARVGQGWTKGPWRAERHQHPQWSRPNWTVEAGSSNSVNTRFVAEPGVDGEKRESSDVEEANARLIAAAPTHDECLWNAVALFGSRCTDDAQLVWLSEAKASLARARGDAA